MKIPTKPSYWSRFLIHLAAKCLNPIFVGPLPGTNIELPEAPVKTVKYSPGIHAHCLRRYLANPLVALVIIAQSLSYDRIHRDLHSICIIF